MVDRRRCLQDGCKVDNISLLPDEILESILGFLSFKEATATTILSRRWRYLHTWTRKLDFDGTQLKRKLRLPWISQQHLDEQRCNFVKWVEEVIAMNQSSTLEEFKVFFNFDRSYSTSIDQWLRFALSRRVETLELNLTDIGFRKYHESYIFPYVDEVEKFKFLKKFSINFVNVSCEFVKELIRNCPHLEHLSLSGSDISSLEIIKPFPSFKCLEIGVCHNLESLVIRDSNIVTLKVTWGRVTKTRVVLSNVPLLSELWCWLWDGMREICSVFSSVLPQLRLLKLFTGLNQDKEVDPRELCCMSNLEQLVVAMNEDGSSFPLPALINLIDALPKLEKLVVEAPEYEEFNLEFIRERDRKRRIRLEANRMMERARIAAINYPKKYPCLKELEIVGYREVESQFEMIMHLVENATKLRNITVNPRGLVFHLGNRWELIPQQRVSQEMLERALQLKNYVPPRIKLNIL